MSKHGIKNLILEILQEQGEVRARDIIKKTGFSRTYVNRFFQALRDEGLIVLIGKANKAKYIKARENQIKEHLSKILEVHRILRNENLSEDLVLKDIKRKSGIFLGLRENVLRIVDYAFLEMLNNAIEHSRSERINVRIKRAHGVIWFEVVDKGIGIFNNIMEKKHLSSELEAIQDLIKGKQTTLAESHSGEGIFFTSKAADVLTIKSSKKKLIFNNLIDDVFLRDGEFTKGTRVTFSLAEDSQRDLGSIFKEYTTDSFEFDKTKVTVRLYRISDEHISRSQARRILTGIDKFKTVILDFKEVKSVGQGFADEIFRVWKRAHPRVEIGYINTNENIEFMINRAKAQV